MPKPPVLDLDLLAYACWFGLLLRLLRPGAGAKTAPAVTWLAGDLIVVMGVGFATIFAAPFVVMGVHVTLAQSAALWGLLGKVAADGMVKAVEKLDFGKLLGVKK